MRNVARFVLTLAAAAIFAGCGLNPATGVPGVVPQSRASGTSGQDLIYASNNAGILGQVQFYTMDGTQAGMICCFDKPSGLCSDKSGNVFIVAAKDASLTSSRIYKVRHGSTKITSALDDPGYGHGCGVDPASGDLAVANVSDTSNPHKYGDVAIFARAKGKPTIYQSSAFSNFWFCGYDDQKNLYVSAFPVGGQPEDASLLRLNEGNGSFDVINLIVQLKAEPGHFQPSVQWDGKHITVSSATNFTTRGIQPDSPESAIDVYRLRVSGSHGTIVTTTTLNSGHPKQHIWAQTWIYKDVILGHYILNGSHVAVWPYPQGGAPKQSFVISDWAEGLTVSVAPSSGLR